MNESYDPRDDGFLALYRYRTEFKTFHYKHPE
jgi:hypothetical protein